MQSISVSRRNFSQLFAIRAHNLLSNVFGYCFTFLTNSLVSRRTERLCLSSAALSTFLMGFFARRAEVSRFSVIAYLHFRCACACNGQSLYIPYFQQKSAFSMTYVAGIYYVCSSIKIIFSLLYLNLLNFNFLDVHALQAGSL